MRQGSALDDIVVVDCSATGSESADGVSRIMCRLLRGAGAHVLRIRPDADRARRDATRAESRCRIDRGHGEWTLAQAGERAGLLASADVVLVRGDGPVDAIDAIADQAVVVVIDEGDLVDDALPVRSHELVAQAATGTVFEYLPGRAAYTGFQAATYGAAINAATAVAAALVERLTTGRGQRLRVSMAAGAVAFMAMVWVDAPGTGRDVPGPIPVGADVPSYECADGAYVCISSSPRCPNSLELLTELLGLDVDPESLRGTRRVDDLAGYFYNRPVLARGFKRFPSAEIVDRLQRADFAVEIVRPPAGAWQTPEVIHSGLLTTCPDCGAEYAGAPIAGIWT